MRKAVFALLLCMMLTLPLMAAATKDIVYVTKAGADSTLLSSIAEKGYSVDTVDISDISSVNFTNYKMILLGNDGFTTAEAKKIPINLRNSIVLDVGGLTQWGWSTNGAAAVTSSSPRNLPVWNQTSPIVAGVPDEFAPYVDLGFNNGDYTFYYISNSKKAAGMNTIVADALVWRIFTQQYVVKSGPVVATVLPGGALTNGNISQARGIFFGISNTDLWTADTKTIFENSLDWVIKGEDNDHDGFYTDRDCNDQNSSINPNATEIPYNYIDENCDGKDVADVDNDGYCKLGYIIMNKTLQCNKETGLIGTDCNDNDASYNPGASDKKKNCVNDAPILSSSIPNQTWNEDTSKQINLDSYFSDPDGENLIYNISDTSIDENITLTFFPDGWLKFQSAPNWNGNDWVILQATDPEGVFVLSNKITLTVNAVNDAPVLQNISDISVVEGEMVKITANATDIEGDPITYSISDTTKFQQSNNVFTWQTHIGNANSYQFIVRAEDNQSASSSKLVNVNVIPKILINEFVSDHSADQVIDWVEFYNPGSYKVNLSNCELKDGVGNQLYLSGTIYSRAWATFNWSMLDNKGDNLTLYCNDLLTDNVSYGNLQGNAPVPGKGESAGRNPDGKDTGVNADDFIIFNHPTRNLPNNYDVVAPTVSLISPANGTLFRDTRDVELKFTAIDDKAGALGCQLYVNGVQGKFLAVDNGTTGSFMLNSLIDGNYSWNVKCSDGTNLASAPANLIFQISAPDVPILNPIGSRTVNENQTLTFEISATDPDAGDTLTLTADGLPQGANFTDKLNGRGIFSWTPDFSQSGDYSVKFTVTDSTGLKDSETITIAVGNVKEPPKFSDINTCKNSNSNISITIENPSDGDSFKVGEIIKGDATIDDNSNENIGANLKFYLYDITREKVVEQVKQSVNVKGKDSKDVKFELTVPEDADESHEFAVFAKAEAKDDSSYCNQQYVPIVIEREDHKIVFKEFTLTPDSAGSGEYSLINIRLKNIGASDETGVYVRLESTGLNISQNTQGVDMNSNDEQTIESSFKVPQNVEKGSYDITATVFFDDGNERTSELGNLTVIENSKESPSSPTTLSLTGMSAATQAGSSGSSNSGFMLKSLAYEMVLVLSLLLLIVLAVLVRRGRANQRYEEKEKRIEAEAARLAKEEKNLKR